MRELIATEVAMGILDVIIVIFPIVKNGMMEIMEERVRAFRAEIAAGQIWGGSPLFREFEASVMSEFFEVKDTNIS